MKEFIVSDVTLQEAFTQGEFHLSFREKIEIAKRLDNLGVSVIETAGIVSTKVDSLLIYNSQFRVYHMFLLLLHTYT